MFRSFHSTVDHAIAMVGFATACSHPSLDGSEYDIVCSIMKSLADPDPHKFVQTFRHLFWEIEMVGRRRLTSEWTRIGNAFKCGGLAVAAGLMCSPISEETYINEIGTSGMDSGVDEELPQPCGPTVNTTKNNCENSSMALGLNPTSIP